ncbi:MAG: cobyrinic acid a,c-diamide synthase [Chloroflexi bacterium]|nr:MAG: cobyrinic acid a,c-diamide synthase [Chloroflexota bacterium]
MTIISLYSNKGGVGKTATAVNLAYLAAQSGATTLLCDLDPQSSATFYFRIKPKLKKKARGFTRPGKAIEASIKGSDYPHLDLLPADFSHRNLDLSFYDQKKPVNRLRKILNPLSKEYDYIFLDCPPTINVLAENIFNASDYLLVPLIPTTLSLRTHLQLLDFLEDNGYKSKNIFTFLSMVDRRKKLHKQLSIEMPKRLKRALPVAIPYQSEVEKMGIYREPVPAYAPQCKAAHAYKALWQELHRRLKQ